MAIHETFSKTSLPSQEDREAVDKKQLFREKMLERIRMRLGPDHPNQQLMEVVLLDICLKVTSVHVGCLEEFEQSMGEELWAYKMPPEEYSKYNSEEQQRFKRNARKWSRCRKNIQDIGNDVIDQIVNKMSFLHLSATPQTFRGEMVSSQIAADAAYRQNRQENGD